MARQAVLVLHGIVRMHKVPNDCEYFWDTFWKRKTKDAVVDVMVFTRRQATWHYTKSNHAIHRPHGTKLHNTTPPNAKPGHTRAHQTTPYHIRRDYIRSIGWSFFLCVCLYLKKNYGAMPISFTTINSTGC